MRISCFMIFAHDFYLAVCFVCVLYYKNYIRQKANSRKFEQFSYLSSKWVVRQWRQLTASTLHLAQDPNGAAVVQEVLQRRRES